MDESKKKGNSLKNQLLQHIGKVFDTSGRSKLRPELLDELKSELELLSQYFNLTIRQSFVFSLVLAECLRKNSIDIDFLVRYLDCNALQFMEYSEELELLIERQMVIATTKHCASERLFSNMEFEVNSKIIFAILASKPIPALEEKAKTVIEVLEQVHRMGDDRDNKNTRTYIMVHRVHNVLLINQHFPLVKSILGFKLELLNQYLLVYMLWEILIGRQEQDLGMLSRNHISVATERVQFLQDFYQGTNELLKHKLLEMVENEFINNSDIKLSKKAINLLSESGLKVYSTKKKHENQIEFNQIPKRKLHFNPVETEQVILLSKLLTETHLRKAERQLVKKNMSTGITILLHGHPGTGKTETVLQTARQTKRDIYKVDISKTKSAWFGESQKIIKKIFTDYQDFSDSCKRMPILLFNEADAILSKRMNVGHSSTMATENAIQNILLEELENFKGIFIATTNMTKNLDTAFDRRFLFKVRFNKPTASIKSKIWKDNLPKISTQQANQLADTFPFSGGQINNIARKVMISEIIWTKKVDFNKIIAFCREESMETETRCVGFAR